MPTLAIQPGAVIFVTGANGLIGSHIIDQLLKRGYNIRGAVRSLEKCRWLLEYFDGKYENARLELVEVPDMAAEGCYDEVVKGTSGLVHVASPLTATDPAVSIPLTVSAGLNALKAAAKTPSITRVVYTSSSLAATFASNGVEKVIDENSYNEEGIQKGWNHTEHDPRARGYYIYAALKASAEKACWKWVKENKPNFAFSTIVPNVNQSKVLVPERQGALSTIEWAKVAFTGENFDAYASLITPQWFISTQDCALLHIAALLFAEISSERLFGFVEPWSFNRLLAIYRKQYPDRKFPEDVEEVQDNTKAPMQRAGEVLEWVKGGKSWDTLEEAVKEMSAQFL